MRGRAGLISTVGCLLSLAATIADAGVLTAYQADGSESTRSSEMALGGTGPATDVCAAAAEPLRVGRFFLRPRRARVLTARGSFPVAGDLDPTVAGVSVELRGSGGDILYGATVPPSAFDSNRRHTRFRLRTHARARAGGRGRPRPAAAPPRW